jgi:hypothetical protein
MIKNFLSQKTILTFLLVAFGTVFSLTALADHQPPCRYGADCYRHEDPDPKPNPVKKPCKTCGLCDCQAPIEGHHKDIRAHMTKEFMKHRDWMVEIFFLEHILPAMAMMTSQLSTAAIDQAQMVGRFFDAKHQMETQRLFQKMMAEAHKDYQPSEGMCEIATNIRSLATSSRKNDLGLSALADRMMKRQLSNGDVLSSADVNSDQNSRLKMFIKHYCNKRDNSNGLGELCKSGGNDKERMNKDVDFTRSLESRLTINADFTKDETATTTPDEEDLFALSANLFAHDLFNTIPKLMLATPEGQPWPEAYNYLNLRSVAAKRSVGQNSFAAIASERAKGDPEVAKYLKKIVVELGIPESEVDDILGENPSYFAQMEVLTKDIYQNPTFYTELYDKPANVLRKGAALRAINLMQERDLFRSQLRSEAVLAVILETMLESEHERVSADLAGLTPEGEK